MRWLWLFPGVIRIASVETRIIMSKNYEKTYYAVGRGRETGIFDSWKECKAQVDGVQNAKYRKFYSLDEANDFVNFWKCYTSPVRENAEQNDVTFEEDEGKDKKVENSKTLNGSQSPNLLDSSKSVGLIKQEPADESIFQLNTSPSKSLGGSSCHSILSISDSVVVKSMDLLALNLRLDSLEKRFDTCLKEIGGILSQVANIRTEVIGIRELLTVDSGLRSSSSRSSKGGMVQSVLSFSPDSRMGHNRSEYSVDTKSSSFGESRKTVTSSRVHNPSKDGDNESEVSDRRALKRKLSKSREDVSSDSDDCEEHPAVKSRKVAVSKSSFTIDKDNYVEVYTDGACHFNGNTGKKVKAGIGVWFGDNHPFNVGEPVEGPATSNTAEIQAARVAVDLAIFAGITKLKIYTDSEFLINCITKWIYRWQKNGWKLVQGGRVKNKKELEKLYKVASKIDVRWEKVAGHTGIKGNEMADKLANAGAEKYVAKS